MLGISQKALLTNKIQELIARIDENIADLEEACRPISPENAIGRVSRMDAINNKSVAEESLRKANQQKIQLEEALNNIKQSDFGQCQSCKKTISFERLLIMPEAKQCMNCSS